MPGEIIGMYMMEYRDKQRLFVNIVQKELRKITTIRKRRKRMSVDPERAHRTIQMSSPPLTVNLEETVDIPKTSKKAS